MTLNLWTDYEKISLFHLSRLCEGEDDEALKEWRRRWAADWPEMGCHVDDNFTLGDYDALF